MVAPHAHRRGGGFSAAMPMRLSLTTLFTMFSIFCNIFLFVIVFIKMTDTKQCIQQDITQIKCPPCTPCVCDNDDSARVLTLRNAAASPFKQLATQLATQAYMQQDSDEDDEKPHAMYFPEDLTEKANFDPASHEVTWKVCVLKTDSKGKEYISPTEYLCENNPRNEQSYQLQWYGSHVRKKTTSSLHPPFVKCVQLPPEDYKFPAKYPVIPAMSDAVHWPNLRVVNRTELIVFNKNTPKNLYHFNAPAYDAEALNDLKIAARYIPFGKKVRTMLDVGAGGGSMGVLVRRKYDVQTVSTIFADWPYCEYITERGNPCLLSDSMESLPFAKFSFDLVHISWVYHGQQPDDVVKFLREANRVTRPGGYIWLYDGWSKSQVDAIELTAKKFGWHLLHEYRREIEKEVSKRISFGKNLPYEWEWRTIFVKPIRYVKVSGSECDWTSGLTYNVTDAYDEEDEPFPPLPGQVVEKKAKPTPKPKPMKEEKEAEEDGAGTETPDKVAAPAPGKTKKSAAPKKAGKPAIPAAPAQPAAPAGGAGGEEEEGEEEEEKAATPAPVIPAAPVGKKTKKSQKAAPVVVTAPPAPAAGGEEDEEEEEEAPTSPPTPPPPPKKKKKSKKVQPAAAAPAAAVDPALVAQQASEQAAAAAAGDAPAAAAQAAQAAQAAAPVKKKKKKIKGIPDGAIPPAPGQLAAQQAAAADANQAEPAADESKFGVAGAGPPARPYQPGDQ